VKFGLLHLATIACVSGIPVAASAQSKASADDIAKQFISAIVEKDSISSLAQLPWRPRPSFHNPDWLFKLSACQPGEVTKPAPDVIEIDWKCAEKKSEAFTGYANGNGYRVRIYLNDSQIEHLAVNYYVTALRVVRPEDKN